MTVWIVALEWNQPPCEVTGDPGLVGAYWTQADAERVAAATRRQWDAAGEQVYEYSMREGRYCIACGVADTVADHHCEDQGESFCDQCGAELSEVGTCDNDHDEWTIDVHVRELTVEGTPPTEEART